MLFHSFPFLFGFLPLCLLGYFFLGKFGAHRLANFWLAVASLAFYGYWPYGESGRQLGFVGLLCASTVLNYYLGRRLRTLPRGWLLALAIGANLALLGWFKYSGLAVQTLNQVAGTQWALPPVILPLAISFYTFTQIAYLVDSYRGLAAELSLTRYSLFVSFFPHLIAGPIVHHAELMPQFAQPAAKRWNSGNVSVGLCWLTLGLFKKVVLADSFAPLANFAFSHSAGLSCLDAWAGTLAYAFQLYFDFSGYSDMAIGLSWFFNIRLPDNFNAPYRASDIIDFWRRWHITLSRFLRDYLYIPLGGNRRGPFRRYANLFITMLLGGIWHGAGWMFLLWGCYHGVLLVAGHLWKNLRRPMPGPLARVLTFLAVLIGWVLFRSPTPAVAGEMIGAMIDFGSLRLHDLGTPLSLEYFLALLATLVFVQVAPTTKEWIERRELTWPQAIPLAALFCVVLFVMRNVALQFSQSEFIYFRF